MGLAASFLVLLGGLGDLSKSFLITKDEEREWASGFRTDLQLHFPGLQCMRKDYVHNYQWIEQVSVVQSQGRILCDKSTERFGKEWISSSDYPAHESFCLGCFGVTGLTSEKEAL